ncbi:S41 family peptidase [Bowmanella denitrificans]|uniref:S41 family peptidase n=1 Tax=Bowmanella denitrificans TaxID=366582 RepID=A0ABP3HH13_9ALTE
MHLKNLFIAIFAQTLLASTSCAADRATPIDINGTWQTSGYGYVFDVDFPNVAIYELTAVSCVESGLQASAIKLDSSLSQRASFAVKIDGFINAEMEIAHTDSPDEVVFHRTDTAATMRAQRLKTLPALCNHPKDNSADFSLKVFLQTFKEHYPFFVEKDTDWATFSQVALPQGNTTDTELFGQLVSLVEPLYDSHVAIVAANLEQYFFGEGRLSDESAYDHIDKAFANVEANYLMQPLVSFCQDRLGFALLPGNVGYLRVKAFSGCSETGQFADDESGFGQALDTIFTDIKFSALVIDLRDNSGGSGRLAIQLAQRFAQHTYIAYRKQAAVDFAASNAWTEPEAILVATNGLPGFNGNIALLTSYQSISSAEAFAMALMQRSPKVVRIGQRTRGVFSDILPRTLPNGWLFGLPNERYLDAKGNSYDEQGIQPDMEISNSKGDLENGQDKVLEAALRHLQNTQ